MGNRNTGLSISRNESPADAAILGMTDIQKRNALSMLNSCRWLGGNGAVKNHVYGFPQECTIVVGNMHFA